jgi:hypothetical protein
MIDSRKRHHFPAVVMRVSWAMEARHFLSGRTAVVTFLFLAASLLASSAVGASGADVKDKGTWRGQQVCPVTATNEGPNFTWTHFWETARTLQGALDFFDADAARANVDALIGTRIAEGGAAIFREIRER